MIAIRVASPLVSYLAVFCAAPVQAQRANMSFFITGVGAGKGADLGGLAGAEKHRQDLAKVAARVPRLGTLICRGKARAL